MSIIEVVENAIAQVEDQLNGEAEGLVAEMQNVGGRIGEVQADTESRFSAVQQQAEGFLGQVESAESTMADVTSQLQSHASSLRESLGGAIEEGNSFFESARGVVESLDQGVQGLVPEADEVNQAVQQVIDGLSDQVQNLDQALEATRNITDQHLHNPFASLIDDLNNEVQNRCQEWGQYITGDLLPTAQQQIEEFKADVDRVVEEGQNKLNEVRDTIETEGNSAIESLENTFGDTFGGLLDTAETLAGVMDGIGTALSTTTDIVGTTTKVLSSGVNMTGIGAKSAINTLNGIVDIFNSVV